MEVLVEGYEAHMSSIRPDAFLSPVVVNIFLYNPAAHPNNPLALNQLDLMSIPLSGARLTCQVRLRPTDTLETVRAALMYEAKRTNDPIVSFTEAHLKFVVKKPSRLAAVSGTRVVYEDEKVSVNKLRLTAESEIWVMGRAVFQSEAKVKCFAKEFKADSVPRQKVDYYRSYCPYLV